MLKIKQRKWRGWARLFLKMGFVIGALFVMFGVLFGIGRGVGEIDGNLVLFCRICREYVAGDALLMEDGEVIEYGEANGGVVVGKVMAMISVRGFLHEVNE